MVENGLTSPELVKALKRYREESGETERSAASRIGVNRHTLHRCSVTIAAAKTIAPARLNSFRR